MSLHKAHCLFFYRYTVHVPGHKSLGNNAGSQGTEFLQCWHKQPKSSDTHSQWPLTSPEAFGFQHIRYWVKLVLNNSVKEIDEGLGCIGRGTRTQIEIVTFEGWANTVSFVLINKSTATTAADHSWGKFLKSFQPPTRKTKQCQGIYAHVTLEYVLLYIWNRMTPCSYRS